MAIQQRNIKRDKEGVLLDIRSCDATPRKRASLLSALFSLLRKERIEGSRVGLGEEASITQYRDGAGNLSAKPFLITLPS